MSIRRLGALLILAGVAVVVLSVAWFFAAYGEAIETTSQFGGGDVVAEIAACLYSSSAICEGVSFFGSSLPYTPIVFWIGVVSLLAGLVLWLSSKRTVPDGAGQPQETVRPLSGLISSDKYTRNVYILMLIGAAGCLLLPPLAVVGLLGFVLALLGVFAARPQLNALDRNHLAAVCVIFVSASALLVMALGSFFFLVIGVAQLALYYVGFNSYRGGRPIGIGNIKEEAMLALKPGSQRRPGPE